MREGGGGKEGARGERGGKQRREWREEGETSEKLLFAKSYILNCIHLYML